MQVMFQIIPILLTHVVMAETGDFLETLHLSLSADV